VKINDRKMGISDLISKNESIGTKRNSIWYPNLKSRLIKIGVTALILVLLRMVFTIALLSFFLTDAVISFIREHNSFYIFYKYGCYGDIDVRDRCLIVITAVCLGLAVFCIRSFK
jgi:hypothetical protein